MGEGEEEEEEEKANLRVSNAESSKAEPRQSSRLRTKEQLWGGGGYFTRVVRHWSNLFIREWKKKMFGCE
jgi:hypothetical protein